MTVIFWTELWIVFSHLRKMVSCTSTKADLATITKSPEVCRQNRLRLRKSRRVKKNTIRTAEKKLRFSYKEQKEYEVIDEEIAALEQKIAKLDSEIEMAATQYSRLTELTQEKSELEEQLSLR